MAQVPGGTFLMGNEDASANPGDGEGPVREVAVEAFRIDVCAVSNAQFTESLRMASEARVAFSGVLCGRATWKEGIPVYAKQGAKALEDWLGREGVKNINAVNDAIQSATAWYEKMGLAVSA